MKWFLNMKIRAKLILCFLVGALLTLGTGAVAVVSMEKLLQNDQYMYSQYTEPLADSVQLAGMFQQSRVVLRDYLDAKTPDLQKKQLAMLEEKYAAVDQAIKGIGEGNTNSNMTALLATVNENYTVYKGYVDQIIALVKDSKPAQGHEVMDGKEMVAAVTAMNEAVDALTGQLTDDAQEISKANEQTATLNTYVVVALAAFSVLLSLALGFAVSGLISQPLRKTSEAARKLAAGETDINLDVRAKDETGVVAQAVQQAALSISAMVQDANLLAEAAADGRLSVRADASRHQGDYRRIVEGFNQTLDLVVGPVNVAADQLGRISRGEDLEALDVEAYHGDFRAIIVSLNDVRYTLMAMLSDVDMLTQATREGRLSARADAERHLGAYRGIVGGVNDILDAVLNPISEVTSVLQRMANGDLGTRVEGDYVGDHAQIKNALNDTLDALQSYVGEISAVVNEMAAGNLDVSIDADYHGDFAPIKDSLNNIVGSLNEMFAEMAHAAEQVASGTGQVSAGSQALSQGATEQASAIEQLTASVTEIAGQTKENALNATRASDLTATARDQAVAGDGQMKAMQRSMEEINASSASISKIIKVIDDIAFQTNLLALNAAVEAARAGQHGKGFAVVAEEVRSLAARSATAAKETTDLIENSVKKAEQGTKLANETAAALEKIVSGVENATHLVSGIAQASNDQALAVSQVNRGIEQVSQVVQTNSATAEESAATSEELSSQAELLKEMVGRFHLKNTGAPVRQAAAKPAALPAGKAKPKISFDESDFGKY